MTSFDPLQELDSYDVTWDSPSANSAGAMPLGNGDIAANVWCEPSGDVLLLLAKSDAWSEVGRLLKLGRVRLHFEPNPLQGQVKFAQALHLRDGSIRFMLGDTELKIWIDANASLVHIEGTSEAPHRVRADFESWRTAARDLVGKERSQSAYGLSGAPFAVRESADVVAAEENRIVFYHRNEHSVWQDDLNLQGLGEWSKNHPDPLMYRTFGGALFGPDFQTVGTNAVVRSTPTRKFALTVSCLTSQDATIGGWHERLAKQCAVAESTTADTAWNAHQSWWREFWNRSYIFVAGDEDAKTVTRGYIQQRFVTACAGRGAYPIKFNGSLFTVEARAPDENFNADYRRWGGPYWFQNTRLIYWPLLASGDFDVMEPFFAMYRNALSFAAERTHHYFEHDGAYFPETITFWGTYAGDNYGWDREGKKAGDIDNNYIRWYYTANLELAMMALQYFDYTDDQAFLRQTALPLAESTLAFYAAHFPCKGGVLRLEPAQALETYWAATDPAPDVAGLRAVVKTLLRLPESLITAQQRAGWQQMQETLPTLPQDNGVLLPALPPLAETRNYENPELYAIFPFGLYGVGKPELDLARRTFSARKFPGNTGWQQDAIQAARLGLAEDAKLMLVERFSAKNAESRFEGFYGPNFDWVPDQDHVGVAVIALQQMLLQFVDGKELLCPAWPQGWSVRFKLHAPHGAIVEYAGG